MYRENAKPETDRFKQAIDPIIIDNKGSWFDRNTSHCWSHIYDELWVTSNGTWIFMSAMTNEMWSIKDLKWVKKYYVRHHGSHLPQILKDQLAQIEYPTVEL